MIQSHKNLIYCLSVLFKRIFFGNYAVRYFCQKVSGYGYV